MTKPARVASKGLSDALARYDLTAASKTSGVPVAICAGSEELQRGFLQALFTADGHVSGTTEKGVSVRLTSVSLPLLKDVQRLLLNFGIASRVYAERHAARTTSLHDGKGGLANYACQADHDLVVARQNVETFAREIGFLTEAKQNRLLQTLDTYRRGPYREPFVARFAALIPDGTEEVFDLKEPLTDANHVRDALARFDQVEGVSDADRDLAFANIKAAAAYYGVKIKENSWRELGR